MVFYVVPLYCALSWACCVSPLHPCTWINIQVEPNLIHPCNHMPMCAPCPCVPTMYMYALAHAHKTPPMTNHYTSCPCHVCHLPKFHPLYPPIALVVPTPFYICFRFVLSHVWCGEDHVIFWTNKYIKETMVLLLHIWYVQLGWPCQYIDSLPMQTTLSQNHTKHNI